VLLHNWIFAQFCIGHYTPAENSYGIEERGLKGLVVCIIPPIKSAVTGGGGGFHTVVTVEWVRDVFEWSET